MRLVIFLSLPRHPPLFMFLLIGQVSYFEAFVTLISVPSCHCVSVKIHSLIHSWS
jgi:hypothetical protein